jgi:hypothetical protein
LNGSGAARAVVLPSPPAGEGWGAGTISEALYSLPPGAFAPTSPSERALTPVFDGLCGEVLWSVQR